MKNKNFINFSVRLLIKEKRDYLFSFLIFSFIIHIVTSVLFVSTSIKRDLMVALVNEGQVIIKNTKGGRYAPMNDEYLDAMLEINGVDNVMGKIDGYYNFAQARRYFHITVDDDLDDESIYASKDVIDLLNNFEYKKEFNFLVEDRAITLKITKSVEPNIISNNTIFMNEYNARRVLQMDDDQYSYLTLIIPNEDEIENIALKIPRKYPNFVALPDYEIESDYDHLYYYKGGIFMILYIVSLVSFFILLKNQISTVYGSRKKEIAILRSMGFSIRDIIALKFIQNSIVALSAFFFAVFVAYLYVFVYDAPLIRNIFMGEYMEQVIFTPIVDAKMLCLIFIFTVIPYLASILIPSWKLAIEDIDEAMK